MNLEFFERLYTDPDFCEAMGKVTLASGRFESSLRAYLLLRGVEAPPERAGLGVLVATLRKHNFISENGILVLRDIKRQRNYVTHSLFDLFSERIPETVLPRQDLVPLDILVFTEKATVLEENLLAFSRITEEAIQQIISQPTNPPSGLLFKP